MQRWTAWVAALAAALSLSGCLVPEKFQASVTVQPDGSYRYQYDGSATHLMAAMARQKSGSLSAKDEAGLQTDTDKAAKSPGVRKLRYLGDGRYDVSIDQTLQPPRGGAVLHVVSIKRDAAGVYTVSAPPLKDKDKSELAKLGIRIDGRISVTLPGNATVLANNASSTPGLIGKAYEWKVGSFDDKLELRFTLAPQK